MTSLPCICREIKAWVCGFRTSLLIIEGYSFLRQNVMFCKLQTIIISFCDKRSLVRIQSLIKTWLLEVSHYNQPFLEAQTMLFLTRIVKSVYLEVDILPSLRANCTHFKNLTHI